MFSCYYLTTQGFSLDLIKRYRKSGWLKAVGRGAVARASDEIDWTGGLYAIQEQLKFPIFPGAKTALELQGSAHFVPTGKGHAVFLFGAPETKLPAWFKQYDWGMALTYTTPDLFSGDANVGLTQKKRGAYTIRLSSRERAMMEVLYLIPHEQEFEEARLLMENLRTLRPKLVQELLERCNSIKVKRLFMVLAEATHQPWVSKVNLSKVDFGKGKRVIVKGGVFNSKYNISVPKHEIEGTVVKGGDHS